MPFLHKSKKREPWFVKAQKISLRTGLRHAIFYPGGGYYKGDWLDGERSGKGKELLKNGRQYEGDWAWDRKHGFGIQSKYVAKDRRFRLVYIGDHFCGKMEGFGRRHYANGTVYEGELENNKRHGFGRCWYADKSYYEGQWAHDKHQGFGMFVQANGNRYEGEWRRGEKDGWGIFYHLDSGQQQEGYWLKNNCLTSFIKDIPYRQSAVDPTPYPIPRVEIQREALCVQYLNQAYAMFLKYNGGCEMHKFCYKMTPSQEKLSSQIENP
ncbi:UNVERIFIED_CONTAM: hypothetical protein PYX00_005393 [Menopon gallinae]|uniref:MORN repeat-containing protein 3 n=1 Tax=Menopon gallinae TaxID=328185 RepID=A0AAW2HRM4_9NEOP